MLSLLLVAGLVATSLSTPFHPASDYYRRIECSEGWKLIDGTCFLLADASGTWDAGQSFCSHRGAFLATVSTQTQQDAIKAMLSQGVWIGLLYLKEDRSFGWADGSQHSYTSWYRGEPNNNGKARRGLDDSEDCVGMSELFDYKWNDVPCSGIWQFLCSRPPKEITATITTITTSTGTTTSAAECEEGWYISKDTMCYKVSSELASWPRARDACLAQYAQLAAVTSEEQQNFLAARLRGDTWIGLNDREEEGTFTWPDGTEPGYTNWHEGEPNNHGDGEDCVEIWPGARYLWNDSQCDAEKRFVCQKPPPVRCVCPRSPPQ